MFYSKCCFKIFIKFYKVFQILKLSSLKFKNFILEIYQVLYFKFFLSSFKILNFTIMYEKIINFYILKLLFSKFYQAYQVLKF